VARAYTPATADEVTGYVDFVIKAYRPLPPRFPDGGALSQYLCDRVPLYADVGFKGPVGEIERGAARDAPGARRGSPVDAGTWASGASRCTGGRPSPAPRPV